ncbi:MAG: HU family DNA-binding protein [Bacteroidaceae bacterium]
MNNKEFIMELSSRIGQDLKETQHMMFCLITDLTNELQEGNSVSIQGFGTFEIKKKMERIVVNPTTKLRMLIPPKLVMSFKPSNSLKEKLK